MGISLPQDRKKKALVGAIAAGIIAGALTMFIPTSVLESITGATGLSELVPATAAPLGDKARALIAFGAGALTLAIMAILLLRKDDTAAKKTDDAAKPESAHMNADTVSDSPSLGAKLAGLKDRLPKVGFPKMPWVKGENEVRDLSDLPSVRSADAHPDAPVRQPLLATKDLPTGAGDADEVVAVPSSPQSESKVSDEPELEKIAPAFKVEPVTKSAVPATPVEDAPSLDSVVETRQDIPTPKLDAAAAQIEQPQQPPLADIVGKLEASLDRRTQQLAELANTADEARETPASEIRASGQSEPLHKAASNPLADPLAEIDNRPEVKCPPLEAVPGGEEEPSEEMDTALNAALETLHRMNAQAR